MTIGYWKTHPERWPITTISLGCSGNTVSQTDALELLERAKSKDITDQLAAQLIAAKLNVANGAPGWITTTIITADAYLCVFALDSDPRGSARDTGETLKDQLDAYNNGE